MRVLVATGSSGGHIFPALALIERLQESGAELLMVLPRKENGIQIDAHSVKLSYIHASGLEPKLSGKNIRELFYWLAGAWEGLKAVIAFKPDVVIGFGSLNTVSLLFWAWLFRIKTMIHEQNVIAGRANRLLAKFVDKVAVSFAQTNNYLGVSREKIVLTGNPLRRGMVRMEKRKALEFFGFKEGKFNILITGGSQGSHKLNAVCSAAFSRSSRKDDLQLVHISGAQDLALTKQTYAQKAIAHRVFDFLPEMQYAYSMADLVICRAGATTIAELERFALPALLVPYPFAYAHQAANARVLEDYGAAMVIRDEDLDAEKLNNTLEDLLGDQRRLRDMREAYGRLSFPDAAGALACEVLNLNQ